MRFLFLFLTLLILKFFVNTAFAVSLTNCSGTEIDSVSYQLKQRQQVRVQGIILSELAHDRGTHRKFEAISHGGQKVTLLFNLAYGTPQESIIGMKFEACGETGYREDSTAENILIHWLHRENVMTGGHAHGYLKVDGNYHGIYLPARNKGQWCSWTIQKRSKKSKIGIPTSIQVKLNPCQGEVDSKYRNYDSFYLDQNGEVMGIIDCSLNQGKHKNTDKIYRLNLKYKGVISSIEEFMVLENLEACVNK